MQAMQNADVVRIFETLADLLELQQANPFRVRAYRNAARTVDGLTESLAGIVADESRELADLPGIGKDLGEKIVTILETGSLPQLEELREQIPPGVVEMLDIPGLGPKKVATLHKELNVNTLNDLKAAAENGLVAGLKGFGKKTEQSILENIDSVAEAGRRFQIDKAKAAADIIVASLKELDGVSEVETAGSVRRRKESAGDLDVLAIADDSAAVMDHLANHSSVAKVLSRGETKQRVKLHIGIELDLRVVPPASYGAALMYFTGSKEHNIVMRRRAQERGLKLNEYGLTDEKSDKTVAGKTEQEVYKKLDLPWIPPELREDRGEFALAEAGELPKLIEVKDVQGDLHMHTTATDGKNTIREMAEAARERGLKYIAITDHSKRVTMAGGLDAKRLREHWKRIDTVNEEVEGIQVLKGIECDILEDATMDLPDDVLGEADWVLAVLHYGLTQPQDQIMKRLLTAIENPHVHCIGHPTGRIVLRRPAAAIDFDTFLAATKEHGKLLEINASPKRLDLDDVRARAAKEHGIPIVINTDSHNTHGFEKLEFGIYQARRAGLTKQDVANTKSWSALKKLLP